MQSAKRYRAVGVTGAGSTIHARSILLLRGNYTQLEYQASTMRVCVSLGWREDKLVSLAQIPLVPLFFFYREGAITEKTPQQHTVQHLYR